VVDEIRAQHGAAAAEVVQIDLADLSSVRGAASSFLDRGWPLSILVNNAGLAGQRGTTKDGFEVAFGVNHLGPFLLTELLLPRLKESGRSRIVNVASKAHHRAERIDWDALRRPTASISGVAEYAVSKLCNVLHAKELARRLAGTGVNTYALHPGVIASDVWRSVPWPVRPIMKLFMKSNEEGAATTLWCATSSDVADQSGRYYDECRERRVSRLADDPDLARELWDRSEAWTRS
jgi:dehydrogenase/reductase SDR family protein 13